MPLHSFSQESSNDSYDIAVIEIETDEVQVLTRGKGYGDHEPAWSPDGTLIALTRSTKHGVSTLEEIYLMNADGSGLRQLTDHPATDSEPAWSPDGTRLAFSSDRDDSNSQDCFSNCEIYVLDLASSDITRLTRTALIAEASPAGPRMAQ